MEVDNKAHFYIAGGVTNWYSHSGRQYGFLRKLEMDPSFDPAIPLLGLYPKDLKSSYYRNTVTLIFIAAQLTIAKLWNQTRCPSTEE